MESKPPTLALAQISTLFSAYTSALDLRLPCNASFERYLFNAVKAGVTPEMLRDVIRNRQKLKANGTRDYGLKLTNLIGDEDRIADLLNEAAMLEALKRKKSMDHNRASVLRQTGRSTVAPETPAKPLGEVVKNFDLQAFLNRPPS